MGMPAFIRHAFYANKTVAAMDAIFLLWRTNRAMAVPLASATDVTLPPSPLGEMPFQARGIHLHEEMAIVAGSEGILDVNYLNLARGETDGRRARSAAQ